MADDASCPAYTRDSRVLRLPGRVTLDDLSPEWAWGGASGAGVRVAVVDSGIDAGHSALDGCVDVDGGIEIRATEDGTEEVSGPHDDAYGHGTACAGIIHSIAPEARITSVRVLGTGLAARPRYFCGAWHGRSSSDSTSSTCRWVRPDVSGRCRSTSCATRRISAIAFVVTAANNMLRPSFPSLFGAVTSVACNLSNDPLRFHYNPEPPTEFLAPGIDVEVPWLDNSWVTGTGNSYAAPHIVGLAALVRSKHPELRPFQVKTVLWATAANVREAPEIAGRLSRVLRPSTTSARASAALRGSLACHP